MNRRRNNRITLSMVIRVFADILLIHAAVFCALALRYIVLIQANQPVTPNFAAYVQSYLPGLWALTIISLIIFYLTGFYTYGRMYRGRYKALVVAQAVSLSFLIFGFLAYFLPNLFSIPRGAMLPAWIITLALLIGARLWLTLWRMLVLAEQKLTPDRAADEKRLPVVLVIGGAGYIGSALLPQLLSRGNKVRLLDLLLFGTEPISNVLNHPNLEIIQADFRQVDQVVKAMRGVDTVVHLGAIVGDPACAIDEQLTIEVNLMATQMIAEVAKGSGVQRFIFASTCSVYGASDELLDERSQLNPVSLYARSKIASERILTGMADNNFSPVILRFATIFGLSGRTRFDLVVNLLAAKSIIDGQITVFNGDQWRPFVHVEDAAAAVDRIIAAPRDLVHNETFNVGSNQLNYTLQEVGELIRRMVPSAQLICTENDDDRRNYRAGFAKIRRVPGDNEYRTLEYGIQQVINAIQAGHVVDYRDARYSNVKFLSAAGTSRLPRQLNGWVIELLNETYTLNDQPIQAQSVTHPPAERAVGG